MNMKLVAVGGGAVAIALAIGAWASFSSGRIDPSVPAAVAAAQTAATPSGQAPQVATVPAGMVIEPTDRVLGNREAPVQIIEYASLTCPHCADYKANTFPEIKRNWIDTGRVRYVYRDFPLDQVALQASVIARCAPEERYFPLLEALFQTQGQWATASDPVAALRRIGRLSGMTEERMTECLADQSLQEAVLRQRLGGAQTFAVSGTPTILINGVAVRDRSYTAIDQALRQVAR
ncbi:MAG: DsbA family protein [Alphaproteobacteria bacterium]|nr:DsbA family protein [Alphaproteobacteria bacterium]TAD88798.1 MAG: DsbA family protein [Alphaproteobacteria bacterium]